MRIIGFIALITALFASLFRVAGAELTNNVTAVALMVLLLSLFTDLKEFNFWGLKGKAKEEKKLKQLKGEEAIVSSPPRTKASTVQKILRQDTVVVMDNDQSNFLALAFDIERLMRIAAALLSNTQDPTSINPARAVEILREQAVLTPAGQEQIESIRWLRNMLVQGREHEMAPDTISIGTQVAFDVYRQLKEWIDNSQTTPSRKQPSSADTVK